MAKDFDARSARIRSTAVVCSALLLASCGGGSAPPSAGPAPVPAPASNRVPVVAKPNNRQVAVQGHPFSYDAAQGGATFHDPDGDPLRYEITLRHVWAAGTDPDPPHGVRIEGTKVVGAPETTDSIVVDIRAFDQAGLNDHNEFTIIVNLNSPPIVVRSPADRVVSIGEAVSVDAVQAGTTFADPDGDALSYSIKLRGRSGIAVNGTQVSGALSSVGVTEVTVTAKDAYGGICDDVFLIAAPAPEPGPPTLPATSYIYKDEALPLPFVFRMASEYGTPLWDTQRADNRASDAGATLGRVLFYDKRLSITNTVACASCHEQDHGFSSPQRFSVGALEVPLARHAMPLTNVRYNIQNGWFSDLRAHTLRSLVLQPMQNPEELGLSLEMAEAKLRATPFYPPLFEASFGSREITHARIALALEQFLESLISYRSKFDRAYNSMDNEALDPALVLSAQEMRGFELFNDPSRTRCTACHRIAAGTNEWQANNGLDEDPDSGTQDPAMQRDGSHGVFRAPSLRNIAAAGPYMHDGRFATLRDVIDHYDHGIKDSRDLDGILRTLGPGTPLRMNFTEQEKQDLEAFLRTFTDDEFLSDPRFANPFAP